jgi:protein phosphatase PTC7
MMTMTMRALAVLVCLVLFSWQVSGQQVQEDVGVGAYFIHKTVIIPHDQKKHRGGEDAAAASDTVLVVADGVGGWARQNINPGLYSKLLTETIIELAPKNQSLKDLVHEANWIAASKHLGTATCTTLKITGNSTISTLNVGDSGYSIHRVRRLARGIGSDSDIKEKHSINLLYASKAGQKRFNYPHQLGGPRGDVVADVGQENAHEFQHGDIYIVYSDGVIDNLSPQEFHSCISAYLKDDDQDEQLFLFTSYSLVADCIARTAYELGKDKTFDSPFAKGARQSGMNYRGGKHDDISVIVAQTFTGVKVEQEDDDDPHYSEPVYLYTGPVPPLSDLPAKLDHTEL